MNAAALFSYATIFSSLVPITAFLSSKRKKNRISRAVFLYVSIVFLAEVLNEIYVRSGHKGLIIYNIAFILQILVIRYLYQLLLASKYSKLMTSIILLFLLFFIVVTTFIKQQHIQAPQNWVWTAGGLLVIVWGILHLFYLSKTVGQEPSILKHGPYWISIAFIGYFLYSSSLFFLADQIQSEQMNRSTSFMIWSVHNFNYTVRNLLLAFAIYRISNERDPMAVDYKKYGIDEAWRNQMKPNPNLKQ